LETSAILCNFGKELIIAEEAKRRSPDGETDKNSSGNEGVHIEFLGEIYFYIYSLLLHLKNKFLPFQATKPGPGR